MDPETMLKLTVVLGAAGGVLLLLGLGVKLLFFRRPRPKELDHEALDGLEDRLERTEAKVGELEERLDFTERMLAEARNRAQLPGS